MRSEHAWVSGLVLLGLALFGPLLTAVTLAPLPRFAPSEEVPVADRDDVGELRVLVRDTEESWRDRLGVTYRDAELVLFTDATDSCARALVTGPFYCPQQERVYVDLGFREELANVFGSTGYVANGYVVAHLMGHHLQRAIGVPIAARERGELELQADCFAGIWAKERGAIAPSDVSTVMGAIATVAQNRLQRKGSDALEGWSGVSTEERTRSFLRGFDEGTLEACAIQSGSDDGSTRMAPVNLDRR